MRWPMLRLSATHLYMYRTLSQLSATYARSGVLLVAIFIIAFAAPSLLAAVTAAPSVDIVKFTYAAKEITVAPGTKVVWTNRDEVPHTVTGVKDKSVDSKAMDTGDKFEHTFTKEGDFEYFCVVHPFMTGVVHVRK